MQYLLLYLQHILLYLQYKVLHLQYSIYYCTYSIFIIHESVCSADKISENSHKFLESKVTSSRVLFCPTKLIQFYVISVGSGSHSQEDLILRTKHGPIQGKQEVAQRDVVTDSMLAVSCTVTIVPQRAL